jgi:hypothetical protein
MKTDNVVAIFMTQNSLTGVRSQNLDTGFHFVRENVEDGTKSGIENSSENECDIFTKILS